LTGYRSFLGLFWMTAPLAWLYAVPYERFLTPGQATSENLATLGVVAAWRVFLMMRVVGVLTGYGLGAIFLVMAFADGLVLTALIFLPFPVFAIMGGVHLTPGEDMIRKVATLVCFWGWLTLPVWLFGTLSVWGKIDSRRRLQGHGFYTAGAQRQIMDFNEGLMYGPLPEPLQRAADDLRYGTNPTNWPAFDDSQPRSWHLPAFAAASVAFWFLFLPFTQREQILRHQVERMMAVGDIGPALRLMSEHERSDFPPHWDPPPRERYGEDQSRLLDVLDGIAAEPPSPWVRDIYMRKLEDLLRGRNAYGGGVVREIDRKRKTSPP
jgi:hypothetical protein